MRGFHLLLGFDTGGFTGQFRFVPGLVLAGFGIGFEPCQMLGLRDLGFAFFTLQLELPSMLGQLAFANGNFGLGFDAHPFLALLGNQHGQSPHTLGIERVVFVPSTEVALIDSNQGRRNQCQPQLGGLHFYGFGHVIGKPRSIQMDFFQRARRGRALNGVDKRTGKHIPDRVTSPCDAHTQCLCGCRDTLLGWCNAQFELEPNIRPHSIARQNRVFSLTGDTEREGTHRYFLDLMQDRKGKASSVGHDQAPAKTGAHQSRVQ